MISGIIGFSFGAVESLLNRQYGLVLQKGLRWMCGAAAGGFLGSGAGEIIYNLLLQRYVIPPFPWQIFARTLGWALFGAGMGMGNGWMAGDRKKVCQWLNREGSPVARPVGWSLILSLSPCLTGKEAPPGLVVFWPWAAGSAPSSALVEHLRREVWFAAVSGPMQGKEFILVANRPFLDHPAKPISSSMAIRRFLLTLSVLKRLTVTATG